METNFRVGLKRANVIFMDIPRLDLIVDPILIRMLRIGTNVIVGFKYSNIHGYQCCRLSLVGFDCWPNFDTNVKDWYKCYGWIQIFKYLWIPML